MNGRGHMKRRSVLIGAAAATGLLDIGKAVGESRDVAAGEGGGDSLFARAVKRASDLLGIERSEKGLPRAPLAAIDLDLVISDMARMNDAPLRGFEKFDSGWYVGPGHTLLGNDPRLRHGGKWFVDAFGDRFDLDKPMTAIMPWVVVADGRRHAARNVRVQLANVRLFLLQDSTRKWVSLGSSRGVEGDFFYKPELARSSGRRSLAVKSDGSADIGIPDAEDQIFHGWWTKGRTQIPFAPTDIRAVFISMQGRLVRPAGADADDTRKCELLMQIGADYYRTRDSTWDGVPQPGVAASRMKLVTDEWQSVSAMTFNDVGRTYPAGKRGIDKAEFLENPPPLDLLES
jgi:hypothetical protein